MQVVKGLGETLVGAYPGRALSFVCKKSDLNSPKVTINFYFTIYTMPNTCQCLASFSLLNSELQNRYWDTQVSPLACSSRDQ